MNTFLCIASQTADMDTKCAVDLHALQSVLVSERIDRKLNKRVAALYERK